jgi:hypothetical protein
MGMPNGIAGPLIRRPPGRIRRNERPRRGARRANGDRWRVGVASRRPAGRRRRCGAGFGDVFCGAPRLHLFWPPSFFIPAARSDNSPRRKREGMPGRFVESARPRDYSWSGSDRLTLRRARVAGITAESPSIQSVPTRQRLNTLTSISLFDTSLNFSGSVCQTKI